MEFPVITLCGSTKFKDEFMFMQKELTLQGWVVISVGLFGHSGDTITPMQKIKLDQMHKQKIDMAEAIFVINKNGYVGESTLSEIRYAKEHGKKIYWYEENNTIDITYEHCVPKKCNHKDENNNLALAYDSAYERRNSEMHCTKCGKSGSLHELINDN